MGYVARENISPSLQGLWSIKNYSISFAHAIEMTRFDPKSLSLSIISNKTGLLIQSNRFDRTEYLCGPPCVRLRMTVEGE